MWCVMIWRWWWRWWWCDKKLFSSVFYIKCAHINQVSVCLSLSVCLFVYVVNKLLFAVCLEYLPCHRKYLFSFQFLFRFFLSLSLSYVFHLKYLIFLVIYLISFIFLFFIKFLSLFFWLQSFRATLLLVFPICFFNFFLFITTKKNVILCVILI